MANVDLTSRDAEVIIDGGRVPGRADLDHVVEVAAFIRASRDVEPAPPMSAHLVGQLDGDALPQN
jgi:hypothetical protein